MSEVVSDQDLLNFDLLNDFDLNSFESFDQYLNNENNQPFGQPFDDKYEPNLTLNTFHNYYHNNNSNNDLNSVQNQWFLPYNGFNNENNQRFESNLFSIHTNRPQIHTNGGTNCSVNPFFATTFGESSYYHNQNRNDQISEQLSFNGYDSTINELNPQKSSPLMINQMSDQKSVVESSQSKPDDNQSEDLPESVTQLNGQLLSTQEFSEQNQSELFCEEKMDENSNKSSIDSNPRVEKISGVQKDDNNNHISNDNPLIIDEKIPICYNKKTYSRKDNGVCKTSAVKKSDISKETIAAVKGLVMLSNSCRKTVIRTKAKKSYLSNLSFAERQRIKRERNRIAAKKCRQKKFETIEKLERMKTSLVAENQHFEEYLKTKRQELIDMKLILLKHRVNDCHLQNK